MAVTRRIAIQMDEPASLNAKGDSTIVLALEAQKRGYQLYYYHPSMLSDVQGEITASVAHPITFFDSSETWFELGAAQSLPLNEMDAVLMRQDPPYDMAYLTATYLLERLKTPVINNPAFVRNAPEKLSILHFADAIPPTLITRDITSIDQFRQQQGDIIVKPLYGYGGRAVYKFSEGDSNLHTLLEHFFTQSREPVMVQRFLPEVVSRDVRVILMNGKVSAAVGRIPAAQEIRANFRVGGSAAKVELNAHQQSICDRVGAWLKDNGVLFAGLDLIGDYLTEINITSPTGLRAAIALYGHNPAVDFWDSINF